MTRRLASALRQLQTSAQAHAVLGASPPQTGQAVHCSENLTILRSVSIVVQIGFACRQSQTSDAANK